MTAGTATKPALVAAVVFCLATVTGCKDMGTTAHPAPSAPSAGASGAVVSGTEFDREGASGTHYAECTTPTGGRYRVRVSAKTDYTLRNGQPCPTGRHEPMPQDAHPDLYRELQQRLPYGGGDINSRCGEWQTVDKAEARRLATKCPPLKWGDLR
jgi:hypothetical protein